MFWTSVWMCKVTALFSNYQIFHSEKDFFLPFYLELSDKSTIFVFVLVDAE